MRNSLPYLEGGGVQARLAGALGPLVNHEPLWWLTANLAVCRRSWILHDESRLLFLGVITDFYFFGLQHVQRQYGSSHRASDPR